MKNQLFDAKKFHKDIYSQIDKQEKLLHYNFFTQAQTLFSYCKVSNILGTYEPYIQQWLQQSNSPWIFLQKMRKLWEKEPQDTNHRTTIALFLSLSMIGDHTMRQISEDMSSICLQDILIATQEKIEERREDIFKLMPSLKPHSFKHILTHPNYFFGSIQCRKIFSNIFGPILPYDPKGKLENSAGILFQEKGEHNFSSYQIDWNIGPTPTINTKLSEEAQAFVFLLQNRPTTAFFPYSGWIYINLQNRQDPNELARVRSIEEMSQQSQSISVASFSVDSPLYLVQYDPNSRSLYEVALELEQKLLDPAVFSIGSMSPYFFSITDKSEQSFWQKNMQNIIQLAYTLSSPLSKKIYSNRIRHKAFHELVLYGLTRAWHGWSLKHMKNKPEDRIFSTISCREGVDRGAALNGGLLSYLTAQEPSEATLSAISLMWGRAILFRGRLNEAYRTEGFFALQTVFSQKTVREYLEQIFRLLTM